MSALLVSHGDCPTPRPSPPPCPQERRRRPARNIHFPNYVSLYYISIPILASICREKSGNFSETRLVAASKTCKVPGEKDLRICPPLTFFFGGEGCPGPGVPDLHGGRPARAARIRSRLWVALLRQCPPSQHSLLTATQLAYPQGPDVRFTLNQHSDGLREAICYAATVFEPSGRDLAGLQLAKSVRQVVAADMLDRYTVAGYSRWWWCASRVEICRHTVVSLQGAVGILPDAEEMDLATSLLAPLAIAVRGQRETREWFRRLLRSSGRGHCI